MNKDACILITGGAGFIGSVLAGYLSRAGYSNLAIADRFNHPGKLLNLEGKAVTQKIESSEIFSLLREGMLRPDFIFHLGARIDTLKSEYAENEIKNVSFGQQLWKYAVQTDTPFVYASSAATYGNDDQTSDDESLLDTLHPLKGYGQSKHDFDRWAIAETMKPPLWAGLKFFNVYGPNEYHKKGRESMVLRSFLEARNDGVVRLFGSNKPSIQDGGHLRDFIYVLDVAKICSWFLSRWEQGNIHQLSGIYNVGTANPRSYNDLAYAVFDSLQLPVQLRYEAIPASIRSEYKDVICSQNEKLRNAGFTEPMYSLEEGVREYIQEYLLNDARY